MISIKYPTDRTKFESDYLKALKISQTIEASFRGLINHRIFTPLKLKFSSLHNNQTLSLKWLLTADFNDIITLSFEINQCLENTSFSRTVRKNRKNKLQKILNYDVAKGTSYSKLIANFFRDKADELNLSSCYYCNIDYINTFKDIPYYAKTIDFVKNATQKELEKIQDIGPSVATDILGQKVGITSMDQLTISSKIKDNLEERLVNREYDHFTLDHVLNKANHPLTALSLYNFVPSCYACNCKFKGSDHLLKSPQDTYLSPTSSDFTVETAMSFKLLLNGSSLGTITSKSDFDVTVDFPDGNSKFEDYLSTFKLKGRYSFHKNEALLLIKKKQRYSQSRIEEIARDTGIPAQKIKEDLYGKELFDGELATKSLTKYKRDIAKSIGVEGID